MLARRARQCCAPLRGLALGWGPAPVALQSSSLSQQLGSITSEAAAQASTCHSPDISTGGAQPWQRGFHSRAQSCPHGAHHSSCPRCASQHSSRLPGSTHLQPHSPHGAAQSLLPWAALGGARRAKAAAAQQQQGGSKMSKQQLLRQKRRSPTDGPVMEQPGIVHVASTKNNTIITLTDEQGNTKAWCARVPDMYVRNPPISVLIAQLSNSTSTPHLHTVLCDREDVGPSEVAVDSSPYLYSS